MKEQLFSKETPLGKFEEAVRCCWSRETAHPDYQEGWTAENAASGQCAVTLVVLADYFPGGEFLKSTGHYHYAYKVGEQIIDLTGEQFGEDQVNIVFDAVSDRERLLNSVGAVTAMMPERYLILRSRVQEILGTPEEFWAQHSA